MTDTNKTPILIPPGPTLVDLDGTLMPSHHLDNECYWQAVFEVMGMEGQTVDLAGFTHVTDNGILFEWFLQTQKREPHAGEVMRIKDRFLQLLKRAADEHPDAFSPLPGVEEWLGRQATGALAIATGGWRHSAQFKLAQAGLADRNIPLRSADDAVSRTDIMRLAAKGLGLASARNQQITYIGDGPWDVVAARELGWAFIGVASGDRAQTLREAGASTVIEDFHALLIS